MSYTATAYKLAREGKLKALNNHNALRTPENIERAIGAISKYCSNSRTARFYVPRLGGREALVEPESIIFAVTHGKYDFFNRFFGRNPEVHLPDDMAGKEALKKRLYINRYLEAINAVLQHGEAAIKEVLPDGSIRVDTDWR